MNIVNRIIEIIAFVAIGYTIGFHRALALCKPLWIEIKGHKGKMRTKWPKEIDAREKEKGE